MIPILETKRLLLRDFRESDFPAFADFFASDRSSFYTGPCDRPTAWRKFAIYPGHWALKGFGPWALEEKETGVFVGLSGLWNPEGWPEPEITWALMNGATGKGYASEAADRARRYAFETMGWTRIISCIAPENAASIRVATRLGAVCEGDVAFPYGTARLYRHRAPDDDTEESSAKAETHR